MLLLLLRLNDSRWYHAQSEIEHFIMKSKVAQQKKMQMPFIIHPNMFDVIFKISKGWPHFITVLSVLTAIQLKRWREIRRDHNHYNCIEELWVMMRAWKRFVINREMDSREMYAFPKDSTQNILMSAVMFAFLIIILSLRLFLLYPNASRSFMNYIWHNCIYLRLSWLSQRVLFAPPLPCPFYSFQKFHCTNLSLLLFVCCIYSICIWFFWQCICVSICLALSPSQRVFVCANNPCDFVFNDIHTSVVW